MNNTPPRTKREHLRQLVAGKQRWSEPLSDADRAKGFLGWHERGYLPHCDMPGLTQFVTIRLADSMPESRRQEWEHLLTVFTQSDALRSTSQGNAGPKVAQNIALREKRDAAMREQRIKLEEYLDRGLGECHLKDIRIAAWVEKAILHYHTQRFEILAWVVMPNHAHILLDIWETPLSKILQNWKSITGVEANKILSRDGTFWQTEYWDRFMRTDDEVRKAIRYIENNPVKAKLCAMSQEWAWSSARFRDQTTGKLILPR